MNQSELIRSILGYVGDLVCEELNTFEKYILEEIKSDFEEIIDHIDKRAEDVKEFQSQKKF